MQSSKAPEPVCSSCRTTEIEEIRAKGERICRICGKSKPLAEYGQDKRFSAGKGLKAAVCHACQHATRPKSRRREQIKNRKRSDARYASWDGVTDREILERDQWRCLLPRCLHSGGREISQVSWPDPWSASVDHVVPLSLGGLDVASNKRAAHLRCNVSRGNRVGSDDPA